ncbi:Regulator of G-protein signaling 14 [Nibea albiflora]|uniref:Regulator of G-protein signaling 14 n=1 Tax=Nibea albiflora TaxID=240163 RepID=A0ACB7EPW5_NIBAL|nr:Regulator of G-protein signaling 14 [Nibea albiflora]
MVALRGLHRRFSHLAKVAAQKQFRKYDKWCPTIRGIMADKKLNMSARGCGGSSSSLPGTPGGEAGPASNVLSWALSFEKLLEDPCGVYYFTLKAEARSIYDTYLSESAPYSINIDDTAKTEEKDLEQPTPDMFDKAQTQIFKLMKMDSYRRFVRSPLYQSCTMAPQPIRMGSCENMATSSPSLSDKKSKMSDFHSLPGGKSASEKHHHKRGSWGDASNIHGVVKASSSVELGSLYRQMENGRLSPRPLEQGGRIGVEGGYCCVYLPDGSASLAPTRNGQPIKDMLSSLCEKRGFPLKDVIIYLHGKDKQPLSLDQDCSVLRDQQVSLELRVTFALEIAFTGKTVGIMVKSSKTLQDALSAVLQKHHLKQQEALVTMVGSSEPLNMSSTVFRLANKTLRLDKAKAGRDTSRASSTTAATQGGAGGLETKSSLQGDRAKTQPKLSKNRDIDGLLDMLTRAQCCRVDDQRGLLTKEQLQIPQFLLNLDQGQDTEQDAASTTSSSDADSKEVKEDKASLTPGSAGAVEETPDSETKDMRETAV